MNSAAKPNSRCSSANSSSTRACTETSSARGRLVGDQQLRVQRERAGQAGALALAAGELVREPVAEAPAAAAPPRAARRPAPRAAAASRRRLCTTSGSATHSAMVSSGLKLDAGSWKTKPMSLAHRPERRAP